MKEPNIFISIDLIEWLKNVSAEELPLTVNLSLDLGKSRQPVRVISSHKIIVDNEAITIPEDLNDSTETRTIYIYDERKWEKWQHFDPGSNRYYKMIYVSPGKPPTIEISGIKMHITQNGDPALDTQNKLKSFHKLQGIVLDTCTGLGYTAILGAKNLEVKKIFTCEKDINVIQLCRQNPWSKELFEDRKIIPILTAVDDLVDSFPDQYLDAVVHDPPRFGLATELYAGSFYRQLYRILKKGGELYHYTGNPNQKIRRISLAAATLIKLKEVGFRTVKPAYAGILAQK